MIERPGEAPKAEVLLTVKEYAALFRRHHQTVYTAIRTGRFKYPLERPTSGRCVLIRVPLATVEHIQRQTSAPL